MSHRMNKEVRHNGVKYEKGQAVSEKDEHFEVLFKGGHVEEGKGHAPKKAEDDGGKAPEGEKLSVKEMAKQLVEVHGYDKKEVKSMSEEEVESLFLEASAEAQKPE